jgi:hypothetical protein
MQQFVKWIFARVTEVLGGNMLERHVVHHKSCMT